MASAQEPLAYLRGNLIPAAECRLPIYDLGIVLGAAVTDLVRTFGGEAYRLEDHIGRLYRSCRYANIQPTESPRGDDGGVASPHRAQWCARARQ
jgi:branched-subunit amino acid aminotransferase/4-amino-4-deoxychorismate lyase